MNHPEPAQKTPMNALKTVVSVLTLAAAATLGLLAQSSRAAVTDTWTGAVNGNWDTATANWSNGGSGVYADGDTAIFSGGANTDLTVQAAGVSPASITFQSTAANYSFTNASGTTGIAGAGSLIGLQIAQ